MYPKVAMTLADEERWKLTRLWRAYSLGSGDKDIWKVGRTEGFTEAETVAMTKKLVEMGYVAYVLNGRVKVKVRLMIPQDVVVIRTKVAHGG